MIKLIVLAITALLGIICPSCTGTYYGLGGSEVINRSSAVQALNLATILKATTCKLDSKTANQIVLNFVQNQRKVLDGAYYTKKDVKNCVNAIYLASCSNFYAPCRISPKEFLESGPYFQGGF
ncbi:MAG: hypothetical protein SFU98_21410 [Leptospiraceae bacterium]|nr:hypothetical protein [Leptospiraceae bacterium]